MSARKSHVNTVSEEYTRLTRGHPNPALNRNKRRNSVRSLDASTSQLRRILKGLTSFRSRVYMVYMCGRA